MPPIRDIVPSTVWELVFRVIVTIIGICVPIITAKLGKVDERLSNLEKGQATMSVRLEKSTENSDKIHSLEGAVHRLELAIERLRINE